jgi:hypothetical protein
MKPVNPQTEGSRGGCPSWRKCIPHVFDAMGRRIWLPCVATGHFGCFRHPLSRNRVCGCISVLRRSCMEMAKVVCQDAGMVRSLCTAALRCDEPH